MNQQRALRVMTATEWCESRSSLNRLKKALPALGGQGSTLISSVAPGQNFENRRSDPPTLNPDALKSHDRPHDPRATPGS